MPGEEFTYGVPTVDLSGVGVTSKFPNRIGAENLFSTVITQEHEQSKIYTPYISQFHRTFSGADYHITAVIPYSSDYKAELTQEVKDIREQIGRLAERIAVGEFETIQEARQQLSDLKDAEAIASNRNQELGGAFYKTFAELQTLSITTRRSVSPVRRLGEKEATYYCRGPRTVAGSMQFVQLDGDALLSLMRRTDHDSTSNEPFFSIDRIPPFNIHIMGMNEYGRIIEGLVHGVTLVATGQVLSIDDLYTEQSVTYVATNFSPLSRRENKTRIKEKLGRKHVGRGFGAVSELESGNNTSSAGPAAREKRVKTRSASSSGSAQQNWPSGNTTQGGSAVRSSNSAGI